MTPKEELTEVFQEFWNMPPQKILKLQVPNFDMYYGDNMIKTVVLKDKCSYCGLEIESPYLQHDECIRIQIEVEKNAIQK